MEFDIMKSVGHWDSKPSVEEIRGMRYQFVRASVNESGLCDLFDAGFAWMPSVMEGGFKRINFASQQLIGLDFDNSLSFRDDDGTSHKRALKPGEEGYIHPFDALLRADSLGLSPLAVYHTYSSSDEWPRFRMIFVLSEPCEDPDVIEDAIVRLINVFPESDAACKDVSRLFFGGRGGSWRLYQRSGYAPIDIRQLLQLPAPEPVSARFPRGGAVADGAASHGGAADGHTGTGSGCRPSGYQGNRPGSDLSIAEIKERIDFLGMIERDAGAGHDCGNRITFDVCPICGHRDDFNYYRDTDTWCCFSDSNPTGIRGGSVIDYVMARTGAGKAEAIRILADMAAGADGRPVQNPA